MNEAMGTISKRLARANETMIALNDQLAVLQAEARAVEAELIKMDGARRELQHLAIALADTDTATDPGDCGVNAPCQCKTTGQ
jgi:hypothetical protein